MSIKYKNILHAWLGLTLSCLFFYPLFATLYDENIILQWRFQNSLELIAAVAIITLLLTGYLWLIDKISNSQIHFVLFFIIFIIPFISFFIHFLRQLTLVNELDKIGLYGSNHQYILATIGLFFGALFVLLIIRYSRKMMYGLIILLLVLSPLNLLAGWTLWDLGQANTRIIINPLDSYEKEEKIQNRNIIVILFDELSYEYLYKNGSINPQYENFYRLSLISDNYHKAISPGPKTLMAIPALLTGQQNIKLEMKYNGLYRISKENRKELYKIGYDNLFAIAKAKGYKTFAYGTYLPYGDMFGEFLDGCRSFSVYNYGTVETNFSLLNPIRSTLIIWPRQRPMGYLKNKAASLWQRKQIEKVFSSVLDTLDQKGPIFMFAHIYLPHLPFVFNKNGYYVNDEPFLQNSGNYQKQIMYIDGLLKKLIEKMKKNKTFDTSEIIVLSDHNYRIMFPGQEDHIPLIIKKPYQKIKRDFFEPVRAEFLLKKEIM